MKIIKVVIPQRMKGERLDSALSELLPNMSRSKIAFYIKSGDGLINDQSFKPNDKASGDEIVSLSINQKQNNNWLAEKIHLDIVYEDKYIIVINKPFGMVTHPGAGNWNGTLANALLAYDANLSKLDRAGIVHRLDKNTSGLMVVAKNAHSQKHLVDQLQNHSVKREYSAIVYGHMISGGKVNEPIGRHTKDRVKQAVLRSGKDAITHYRVVDRFDNHTHVKAILETGRTHQIRVHLSYIGHPLIGAPTYGGGLRFPKKAKQDLKDALKAFKRQALHSKKLTLKHPDTGVSMTWKADIPDDMKKLLDVLSKLNSN